MAYPRYIGKSAFASGTGALTVAALTGTQAGDIIILFAESANQTISTPTGYSPLATQVGVGTAGAAGAVRIATFYRILEDAADTATTVADSGDHTTAIKMLFRDTALYSGVLYTQATSTQTATTAMVFPGVTTFSDESMVILAVAQDTDAASTATVGAVTNANLTSITERHDQTVATNTGGGIAVITGLKATAGATGTSTATGSTSVTHAYHTIALARVEPQTSTTYFNNILTTSYFPASDAMRITANSSGQVNASASGSFQPVTIAGNAFYDLTFKWYWRQYGTDTWTTSTAQASEAGASVSEGVLDNAGTFTDNETITGLTNGVQYEFVLFAARTSATPAIEVSFSASASISLPSTGYTITGESGSFTRTGGAANVLFGREVLGSPGSFSYSGNNANVLFGREIAADAGSYTLTGQDATLALGKSMSAEPGVYALSLFDAAFPVTRNLTAETGFYSTVLNAANASKGYRLSSDQGSYSFSGNAVGVLKSSRLSADAGSFVDTFNAANLVYARTMVASPGSFALTGQQAALAYARIMQASAGSFSVSYLSANVLANKFLAAGAGTYAIAYGDASVLLSKKLAADTGSYTSVYGPSNLSIARLVVAEAGSYSLTAADVGLAYQPLGNYVITASSGSYSHTLSAATLLKKSILTASPGTFSASYLPALTLYKRIMAAATGSYVYVGNASAAEYGRLLSASTGSFAVTGNTTDALYGRYISANTGAFSETGSDVGVRTTRRIAADTGAYSETGASAGVLAKRILAADTRTYGMLMQQAALLAKRTVTATPGTYSFNGQSINLLSGKVLVAASASFNYTADDVTLTYTAEVGVYNIKLGTTSASKLYLGSILVQSAYLGIVQVWGMSGAPASYTLTTSSGTYVISGQSNGLLKGSRTEAGLLGISVSGGPATLKMSRKLAAVVVGFVLTGNSVTMTKSNSVTWAGYSTSSPTSGTFDLTFDSDGDLFDGTLTNSWISTKPDATFASQYEIRWTSLTGSGFSSNNTLTQNTWYALSSPRTFSIIGVQGATDRFGYLAIEIRKIGTTTPVYSGVWDHVIVGSA